MLFIQSTVATRTQVVRTARAFGAARLTAAVATRTRVVRMAHFTLLSDSDQVASYSFT